MKEKKKALKWQKQLETVKNLQQHHRECSQSRLPLKYRVDRIRPRVRPATCGDWGNVVNATTQIKVAIKKQAMAQTFD